MYDLPDTFASVNDMVVVLVLLYTYEPPTKLGIGLTLVERPLTVPDRLLTVVDSELTVPATEPIF